MNCSFSNKYSLDDRIVDNCYIVLDDTTNLSHTHTLQFGQQQKNDQVVQKVLRRSNSIL